MRSIVRTVIEMAACDSLCIMMVQLTVQFGFSIYSLNAENQIKKKRHLHPEWKRTSGHFCYLFFLHVLSFTECRKKWLNTQTVRRLFNNYVVLLLLAGYWLVHH